MLITAVNQNKLKLLPIYIIDKYRNVSAASASGKAEIMRVPQTKLQTKIKP